MAPFSVKWCGDHAVHVVKKVTEDTTRIPSTGMVKLPLKEGYGRAQSLATTSRNS